VLGDAEELPHWWCRFVRLGRAEAEVVENLADRHLVGDKSNDAHALAADLCDQPCPARRGSASGR